MTTGFSTAARLAVCACVAALLAAVLAVVPPRTAAAVDFGGSTGAPPDAGFGCEAGPRLADQFGNFSLFLSGAANCTWLQLPTFGGTPNGGAPVSGRVTAVRVRSGPNPAPLRFTVVRFISGITPSGQVIPNSTQCCFGERTTRTFALRPNAVTTIGLDLPVENEKKFDEGIVVSDFVGISATSNTGTLPVRLTVDRAPNTSDYAVPGVPQVSMHYPEITPGQVRTDATTAPAHLITAVFTMCTERGAGRVSVRAGASMRGGGSCGAAVRTKAVTAKRGKVRLPVACVGFCAGRIKVVRAQGKGKLGVTKRFTIQPGKRPKIGIKLTRAGKAATAGRRTVRARVVITSQGTRTAKVITIK